MARKVLLLIASMATIAVAVPTVAAAAPSLTYPPLVLIKVGTKTTATSLNWTLTTKLFKTFTCEQVAQEQEVAMNTGSSVLVVKNMAGTHTGCKNEGTSVSFTEVTMHQLAMTEPGKGTAALTISIPFGGVTTCVWSASKAPFTYVSGTSTVSFAEAPLSVTPPICGSATLDAEFTLTKFTPGPVIID
jgi:hypothetical protein